MPAASTESTHRLIVFTEPVPGKEREYNEWYDRVHLKEVLEVDGFVAAQRFELSSSQIADGVEAPKRYLAIYEIEAKNVEEALARLNAGAGTMQMSEALDTDAAMAFAYSAIGERQLGA